MGDGVRGAVQACEAGVTELPTVCPKCKRAMRCFTKGASVIHLCKPCGLMCGIGPESKAFLATLEPTGYRKLRRDEWNAKGGH